MDAVESSDEEQRDSEAQVLVAQGINIEALLEQKRKEIEYKVPEGAKRVPWVDTMSIDGQHSIPKDIGPKDGVKLEGEFLKMAGDAVKEAYRRLQVMKIPCSRPDDFYAEMLRTDAMMYKVRARASEELRRIKVVEDRKKAQAAKKFAKRARSKKLEARAQEKRQSLAEIKEWQQQSKQDKKNADDQDLDTIINKQKRKGDDREGGQGKKGDAKRNRKREFADKKFGFGGKKKRIRQNDADSTHDVNKSPWAKARGKGGKGGKGKGKGKGRGKRRY